MQIRLRLLIVWCIALALPLQGIASVTMMHCGPSHEGMHAVAQEAGAHHDHAAHEASAGHDLAKYKCSACASCCAACALPSAQLHVPEPAAVSTVFAEDVITIEPCASDGPDRPPRALLA